MELGEYIDNLAADTAFWMSGVDDSDYPFKEVGRLSLEVAEKLRTLAIVVLVAQGDSDLFFHNLIRSARMRAIYLQRCLDENALNDHHRCSGRVSSTLDAIAAGELELAKKIIGLSPDAWREGHEYEDDYCYARILHHLVAESPDEGAVQPLLEQFEAYLDGVESSRLGVCRALNDRDQRGFNAAFEALLEEQDEKIEHDKDRGELEEPQSVARRQVFLEGLALLRLAKMRGLTTESDYRYCPALARLPMDAPFPGE